MVWGMTPSNPIRNGYPTDLRGCLLVGIGAQDHRHCLFAIKHPLSTMARRSVEDVGRRNRALTLFIHRPVSSSHAPGVEPEPRALTARNVMCKWLDAYFGESVHTCTLVDDGELLPFFEPIIPRGVAAPCALLSRPRVPLRLLRGASRSGPRIGRADHGGLARGGDPLAPQTRVATPTADGAHRLRSGGSAPSQRVNRAPEARAVSPPASRLRAS